MLRIENIIKKYDETVLDGISLTLNKGDFLYVTGKSGAGKTTLLSLLAGNSSAYEGSVSFKGIEQDFSLEDERRVYKRSVQLIKQTSMLDESLTVYENCSYFLKYSGKEFTAEKILTVLKSLGIAQLAASFPTEISGGELSRANLAQVLLMEPEILLIDEVTAALDPLSVRHLCEILEKLHKEGLTILLSTHNLELIKKFPHPSIRLEGGKIYGV